MKYFFNFIFIFCFSIILFGCKQNTYTPISKSTPDYVAQTRDRFSKITPADSIIENYDSINSILSIYSKNKIPIKTDQFDSSQTINEKWNNYKTNHPEIDKIYTIFVPDFKDMIRNDIKYNKEKSKFYCHLPNIYGLGGGIRKYFPILISGGEEKKSGSYTGVNAFGATAHVTKYSGKAIILAGVNAEEIEEKFHGKRESAWEKYGVGIKESPNYVTSMTFTSDIIPPDEAREIYKNIGIAIRFEPYPYILGNGDQYLIKNETDYDSPTLSSPYERKMSCTVIFGKIISIYLVDKSNGKVLGGYSFYK